MIRTHIFKGKRYSLRIDPDIVGLCDNPNISGPKTIHVLKPLTTKNGLRILLHEALHAEDWSQSEVDVERTASEVSDLLWCLGYRIKPRTRSGNRANKKPTE